MEQTDIRHHARDQHEIIHPICALLRLTLHMWSRGAKTINLDYTNVCFFHLQISNAPAHQKSTNAHRKKTYTYKTFQNCIFSNISFVRYLLFHNLMQLVDAFHRSNHTISLHDIYKMQVMLTAHCPTKCDFPRLTTSGVKCMNGDEVYICIHRGICHNQRPTQGQLVQNYLKISNPGSTLQLSRYDNYIIVAIVVAHQP